LKTFSNAIPDYCNFRGISKLRFMRLLLISNSTNAGEEYLNYPKSEIKRFLGEKKIKCLFFPYAGVTISYDAYAQRVKQRFNEIGHDIKSIHELDDPLKAVEEAEAIVIGGGNTFNLLKTIQDNHLIEPIRNKVLNGTPYIGWSAGSNMTCPTIKTTNDMPIAEPKSLKALHLINFQINPHYLDRNPDGHAGETREDRILEFLEINRNVIVIGLREGCMLRIEKKEMQLIGNRPARIFIYGKEPYEMTVGDNFNVFLE
jgi:dipeptidase E